MATDHALAQAASKLAHAIRRSTALTVAMSITPEGSSIDDLTATAERLAAWIRGGAEDEARSAPLGEAWPPRE